jgi:hypothetical protein
MTEIVMSTRPAAAIDRAGVPSTMQAWCPGGIFRLKPGLQPDDSHRARYRWKIKSSITT